MFADHRDGGGGVVCMTHDAHLVDVLADERLQLGTVPAA